MVTDELYEYPSDHVGRKTYVAVRGHSRSIPKYKTYRGTDGYNYVHPDFGGTWDGVGVNTAPMVMGDIKPYISPLDMKTEITSRSHHRDHMRRHDVIEIGNEVLRPRTEQAPMRRAGHDIVRAMRELQGR